MAAVLVLPCPEAVDRMDRFRLEDKGSGKSIATVTVEMAVMGDGRGDDCVCGMDIRAAGDAIRAGDLVLRGISVVPNIGGFGRARDDRAADAAIFSQGCEESLPTLRRQSNECSRRQRCQALAREGDLT